MTINGLLIYLTDKKVLSNLKIIIESPSDVMTEVLDVIHIIVKQSVDIQDKSQDEDPFDILFKLQTIHIQIQNNDLNQIITVFSDELFNARSQMKVLRGSTSRAKMVHGHAEAVGMKE
jgi:uncharacterized protein YggU (UPF0235/DUF167 family)